MAGRGAPPAEVVAEDHLSAWLDGCARGRVPQDSPVVRKLTDNHRMNDILAVPIRRRDPLGAEFTVHRRRGRGMPIRLGRHHRRARLRTPASTRTTRSWRSFSKASRALSENRAEAELVARLTAPDLRGRLLSREGRVYEDDAEFFKTGLFVVSPHRAEPRDPPKSVVCGPGPLGRSSTRSIRCKGRRRMLWSSATASPTRSIALREAEFIYSLNRLNVAITRARCKSILCLPAALIAASPAVLEVPDAARGLAYMHSLVQAIESQGGGMAFEIGGGVGEGLAGREDLRGLTARP